MNKIRREQLNKLAGEISAMQTELESLMEEEEDYRDNMPENLQGSERYEKADEACAYLEDAIQQLEEAIDNIESAIDV